MLKDLINKFLGATCRSRVNVPKTLLINFMTQGFFKAIHFPILIYGPCKIQKLSGRIIIPVDNNGKIKMGRLKIGICDPLRSIHNKSYICIIGNLIVGQEVVIRRGISLSVWGNLVVDDNVYIGDNCTIIATDSINIGKGVRVANNSTFMDTDFHYLIDLKTRKVRCNHAPIEIGDNCWIGGNCVIKKGSKLPQGTILAGPFSMVSKDYTSRIPEFSVIAGSPAKFLRDGLRRVNNYKSDIAITKDLNEKGEFVLDKNVDINDFCYSESNLI